MILINLRTNKRIEADVVLADCIPQDSEDGKRWMQSLSISQERVIDMDNLTVTIEEYQLQDDGTRYKYYLPIQELVGEVMMYVPDTQKILLEAENVKVNATKAEAKQYLASTDWMLIRELDEGTPVPADVKQQRKEARKTANAKN